MVSGMTKSTSRSTLDLDGIVGLNETEAAERLQQHGPNELPAQSNRPIFAIAVEVVREPMFILLVVAGTLYLAMGELIDSMMLLSFVVVVMAITIIQERRTERAIDALRDLSSPRALVIRGGLHRRIPGREVVAGDFVVLSEGDRVPADAVLRCGVNLSVDESLLTGESLPVRKKPSASVGELERPGGDDLSSVYSGTLVVGGQGAAEVLATGQHSAIGGIGKVLGQLDSGPTPLQRETRRLVRFFAMIGLAACAVVVCAFSITRGGGLEAWKQGVLAGITMAMATLPEEFPVVLTVFLAMGAWRISRSNVLTRKMPAVETLGAATVLCVDKTGTLTQNRMKLRTLTTDKGTIDLNGYYSDLPEEMHLLLEHAILASKRDPFDPMEKALLEVGDRLIAGTEHLHPQWSLAHEYPLSPELLAVTHIWSVDGKTTVMATKGAPEAVADLCHMTQEQRSALSVEIDRLSSLGLRVLAVARGLDQPVLSFPAEHHDLRFCFIGLLGFEDPLRPAVPAAVAECRQAGVRVVMITGDYPTTAQTIARQAGIDEHGRVLTGAELDRMSDDELLICLKDIRIFARVVPEQKLRIVSALKKSGEIVAMTGDGVNDAPALKMAHIGIAMGGRGTDVAREAASLVLLDDDFSSIVAAVRLGRRIFDNIKKAISFIVAVHVPIAGLSMFPVFFRDWPLLLLPIHIVFLELIIDPSCTLVFEAEREEPAIMKAPPRSPRERLLSFPVIVAAVVQGLTVLGICLAVFLVARERHSLDAARALTFVTLVVSSLMIILVNRSQSRSFLAMLLVPNTALRWVVTGAIAFMVIAITVPVAQRLFHFAPLHPTDLLLSLGAGVFGLLWFELAKAIKRSWHGRLPPLKRA
jgi:Ca2+-transporting ATPase